MTPAYEFGRWVRKNSRVLGVALAVGVLAVVIVASRDRGGERTAVPAAASPPKLSREESQAAAAEAERQRQLERERAAEAERQHEIEQQQRFERLKKAALEKSRRDVKACVSSVRARLTFSRLDAYVTGEYGETVNYFGTNEDRFHFEKCMAESGTPLTKEPGSAKKR